MGNFADSRRFMANFRSLRITVTELLTVAKFACRLRDRRRPLRATAAPFKPRGDRTRSDSLLFKLRFLSSAGAGGPARAALVMRRLTRAGIAPHARIGAPQRDVVGGDGARRRSGAPRDPAFSEGRRASDSALHMGTAPPRRKPNEASVANVTQGVTLGIARGHHRLDSHNQYYGTKSNMRFRAVILGPN